MAERIGHGTMVSGGLHSVTGRFVALLEVTDVFRVLDGDDEGVVAYLEHPNVTMMAPIHDRLAAILCASGDEQAHVAIVARELGLPCAVQTALTRLPAELDGQVVSVEADGAVVLPAGA